MTPATRLRSPAVSADGFRRGDLLYFLMVLVAYVAATALAIEFHGLGLDRMMIVAEQALHGRLDSSTFQGTVDSVQVGGRYYLALGPLQLAAYLPFAAIPELQRVGGYIAGLLFGIPAAWLALPLVRAYGAKGRAAYWIAGFTAFGSLLFWTSVFGVPYYLAHAEAFLALSLFLLEWAGKRRPILLGLCLGIAFLARPTIVLAAIPFGVGLLWARRDELGGMARTGLAFAFPIAGAIALYGWFNWVRFGSVLESGYSISVLQVPWLQEARAQGLFTPWHIPANIYFGLLEPPDLTGRFPFLAPDACGMSMLLVSPALLTAVYAGFRDRTARLLWVAAAIVALPVFLYYGGGVVQYGFRYSLDFTPFLIALMAMGSGRWTGRRERILVLASIASVAIGIWWYANF
ncbi:MAG TPA: hypothetical protein VF337_10450 [Candidatus Limnocylindrales bacterium]